MRRFIFSEEVMASFKVGDRVRRVRTGPNERGLMSIPFGAEGTVTSGTYHPSYSPQPVVGVAFDGGRYSGIVFASTLAPLTPPAEDAWAADAVRKVTKPVHVEPTVTREVA